MRLSDFPKMTEKDYNVRGWTTGPSENYLCRFFLPSYGFDFDFPLILLGFFSSLDKLSIRINAEKSSDAILSKGICIWSQNSRITLSSLLPSFMARSNFSLTSVKVGWESAVVRSETWASRISLIMLSRSSWIVWLKKSLSCTCPNSRVRT